ncbi:transient receptor potential cation channel subfamily V member 6-like isoform X2 [Bombina bombina]|uniref:transient receptor potential cation channel subfamily V member 6-like isoform X2 n=1 Tax=Bombina bombina TaxID=8345 RepID=UPI00235B2004|nr:transient receptor potential cation channel subfamily V member 6-like isoform X2 [Bombina bombina]
MPFGKNFITVHNILDNKNTGKENHFFKAAKDNNVKLLKRLIGEGADPCMKGETALHIAIVNQNIEMVKELIARKADIRNARAEGTFFAPRKKGHYYYGEYVTSFAASVGNQEILQLLVESGAPLDSQDSQGNTVFHILVLHLNKVMACKIYDFLISLIPEEQVPHLENITNNKGLTPLKLAAREGDLVMFKFFMKRRRQAYWAFGPLTSALYDLTEIDCWNDRLSVIDIICNSKSHTAPHLLEITPLKELLDYKWSMFGFKYFLLWTFLYILYIITLTLCCLYRPLKQEMANESVMKTTLMPLHEAYQSWKDYVRLFGEIVVILGAVLILTTEITQLLKNGAKHFFGNTVTGGPFHIIMLLYAGFILAVMVLRLITTEGETVLMSLALICAWCNVIYFARGFRILGPLCIMIQKMILGDLLRFCIILILVLIGFAAAFHVHFQAMNVTLFPYFSDFPVTLFTLFQLMMGLDNLPVPSDVIMPKMITVLYMVYMLFAFVLLLNLLIAFMADTHFRVNKERKILWRAQIAATTIMLERIVPNWLWPRTGIPGEIIGLEEGKWYLRVEEKNDVFAPDKIKKQINLGNSQKPLCKEWNLVHTNIAKRVMNKRMHQRILDGQI